ncbi:MULTISPECIES: hypothetical protein [unclassified Streptomyces]|nr:MULTISPECIES: hypothetical protein [unclassified Streptomyces]MYR28081.1 hypothetical protein [Streptomyces sp. SID4945]
MAQKVGGLGHGGLPLLDLAPARLRPVQGAVGSGLAGGSAAVPATP